MNTNKSSGRRDGSKSKPFKKKTTSSKTGSKRPNSFKARAEKSKSKSTKSSNSSKTKESTRLNKFLANSGVCSRREADVLIQSGNVTVNGKLVVEMGYQVQPGDDVKFDGQSVNPETKRYVLLNKPKNYITNLEDARGRKTVMELVHMATKERIYPVGRLDRNTTGLLLFTNDGEMAKKLTQPKHPIKKIYHATLDKKLSLEHLNKIAEHIDIDGKKVFVDDISYVTGQTKNEVGIQVHSGRNRIVRKIFESLGYQVIKLDRVIFADLTKKNIPRGHWRFLTEQEVNNLKML